MHWWGPDFVTRDDGEPETRERVATCGGHLLAWPDVLECSRFAASAGWALTGGGDPETDGLHDVEVVDAVPVLKWLGGTRATVDPQVCLNVWNFAQDVAFSVGAPLSDGTALANECYLKLVVANMPWEAHDAPGHQSWSRDQTAELRRVMAASVSMLCSPAITPPLRGNT